MIKEILKYLINIKIYELDEIEDMEYFKKINIEEKYGEKFDEEKVTKESFICLMDKVLQYSPEIIRIINVN